MLAAGLLAALSPTAALSPAATQQTPAPHQQVLRVASATGFSTFNPFLAYFEGDLNVVGNIYPSLTRPGPDGAPLPYLATNWTVSRDQLIWTFTIRKNLRWSDGTPITAADVAWTYNLIITNAAAATANGALVADFKSVTAPNASTLVITTKQPAGEPAVQLASPSCPNTSGNDLSVTTIEHHRAHRRLRAVDADRLRAQPVRHAHREQGLLSRRAQVRHADRCSTYSSEDAAVAALRSGQLDAIDGTLTATQYQALNGDAGRIAATPPLRQLDRGGAQPGRPHPVRHADRQRQPGAERPAGAPGDRAGHRQARCWRPRCSTGSAQRAARTCRPRSRSGGGRPPARSATTTRPRRTSCSTQLATRWVRRVRIDPKTHKPLTLRLGIHSDQATDAQIAPYLVEWLAAIGIKVTIQSMSFTQLNSELPKGDWDMLMDDWATGPDPTLPAERPDLRRAAGQSSPGNTDAFFCDPAYDKLLRPAVHRVRPGHRGRRPSTAMQQILYDADTDMILYYPDALNAVRANGPDLYSGQQSIQGPAGRLLPGAGHLRQLAAGHAGDRRCRRGLGQRRFGQSILS